MEADGDLLVTYYFVHPKRNWPCRITVRENDRTMRVMLWREITPGNWRQTRRRSHGYYGNSPVKKLDVYSLFRWLCLYYKIIPIPTDYKSVRERPAEPVDVPDAPAAFAEPPEPVDEEDDDGDEEEL